MITCPRCNQRTPQVEPFCRICGFGFEDQRQTQRVRNAPELIDQPVWGTTRFGVDNELALYIPSVSKTIVMNPTRRTVLGRLDAQSNAIPDLDLAPHGAFRHGVSRRHAAIHREDDQVLTITDLGSSNHTYLNGEQLTPHDWRVLRDGDEVRLGDMVVKIYFK